METVEVQRELDATPENVRSLVTDVGPFMEAAGFDEVTVDGDILTLTNNVGLLTIELTLRVVESEDVLAYEQVDGIFDEMVTRYTLSEAAPGTRVTARTDFALDVDVVGSILDGTIIARQRRKELTAQFDYLEEVTGS